MIVLTPECVSDLMWWREYRLRNPGQTSRSGMASSLLATWGDGSGTGTGGAVESPDDDHIEQWMGAWHPRVLRHIKLERATHSTLESRTTRSETYESQGNYYFLLHR
jgi:hypothetical protein